MHKFFANSLFLGKKLEILPHCHSTNNVAVEMLGAGTQPEGTVVITENQMAGKGQRGNSWESEPHKNLTFSVILNPHFLAIKDQFYLNMITSLGILEALQTELNEVTIKWPNDIYVQDKKICGILIENLLKGGLIEHSIVGIGLNVNQISFIDAKATSMAELTLQSYDLNDIFNRVIQSIEKYYLQMRNGNLSGIRKSYLSNLYWLNEVHLFEADTVFSGEIVDVDENGRLVVESNSYKTAYDIKEITFLE